MVLSLALFAGAGAMAFGKDACCCGDKCKCTSCECQTDCKCGGQCPDGNCGDHCTGPLKLHGAFEEVGR